MNIDDQATFKGAVKFGVRHVPTGKWYNSARYANGFCETPSLKSEYATYQHMLDQWCFSDTKPFYEDLYAVKMIRTDFEIMEFTLTVTAIIRAG